MKKKRKYGNKNVAFNQDKDISLTKKIIFTIILLGLPFIFFLSLEGALRLFHYGGNLDLFVRQTTGEETEFVLNENFTRRYFFQKGIKTPVPLSQRFPADTDSTTWRIFCLGASTTQGFPYPPNGAFPAILENILTDLYPDKKIHVINCGITAITSHSVLDMQREIMRTYQPDALIIYSGHNEFYGVFGQASAFSGVKNRTLLQLFLKMQRSRLFLLLRNTFNSLFGKKITGEAHQESKTLMSLMAKDISIDLNSDLVQRAQEHYRANLVDMCKLAQKQHTDILLCTLVDNQRDVPPFASQHSENFVAQDTILWHKNMLTAQNLQKAARFQEAVVHYANALQIDSTYALTLYQLAQCYDALGDYDRAREYFISAKDYDVIRFRAPSAFNDIVRQVAQDYHVPLADIEKSFIKRSPGGIPGQNLLHEHVHPNLNGYLLMAQTLAESLRENALVSDARESNLKSDNGYMAMCHLTTLDHEVVNYTLFRLTSQWPFPPKSAKTAYQRVGNERTEQLAQSFVDAGDKSLVELHLEYGNEFHQANEFQPALDEYQAALAIQPLAITYNRIGRLYLRQTERAFREAQDYDAAALYYQNGVFYFTEGLKRWPDDVQLNFNLGLLYFMRADETEAAIRQFQKVLLLEPQHKNACKQLIELYIRRQDYAEAKVRLQQAITLFPEDGRFYTDLGFIYLQEKNLTEAEKMLRHALQLSNDPRARFYLNQILSN
ncbi:tetratricopeptide repeat protein [candidate division KSB1 bacterium]|nr:tetratricopeptide repeat protein [candidate division KSB1 bacterium]